MNENRCFAVERPYANTMPKIQRTRYVEIKVIEHFFFTMSDFERVNLFAALVCVFQVRPTVVVIK